MNCNTVLVFAPESFEVRGLTSETVQGASLSLECIDHIHGGHSFATCVLSVGHCITDDILKEHLEHTTGLFVDQSRDTLHTTTTSETADGGLGDSLDIVTKDLPVALGSSFSKTFSSLSTSGHCCWVCLATVWAVLRAL